MTEADASEDQPVREAEPEDYLVSRDDEGNLKPVTVTLEGKRHLVKPLTYREASELYGDGIGAEELEDDEAVELLREKFVLPDLTEKLHGPEDLLPASAVQLLTVLHEASQINADIQREDGLSKVDFSGEKKTDSEN